MLVNRSGFRASPRRSSGRGPIPTKNDEENPLHGQAPAHPSHQAHRRDHRRGGRRRSHPSRNLVRGSRAGMGTVYGTDAATAVSGSYIVMLDEKKADKSELAKEYGGKLKRDYNSSINGFSASGCSETEAKRLAADPAVAKVVQNRSSASTPPRRTRRRGAWTGSTRPRPRATAPTPTRTPAVRASPRTSSTPVCVSPTRTSRAAPPPASTPSTTTTTPTTATGTAPTWRAP